MTNDKCRYSCINYASIRKEQCPGGTRNKNTHIQKNGIVLKYFVISPDLKYDVVHLIKRSSF